MSFTPLSEILPKAIRSFGVKKELEAALICEHYRKIAPTLIHKDALSNTRPYHYKDKVLTIGVQSAAWAHVVMQHKDSLIKEINALEKQAAVTTIKTKMLESVTD